MTLEEHKAVLIAYLKSQLEQELWPGVRDTAADLEVIEARMEERANAKQE